MANSCSAVRSSPIDSSGATILNATYISESSCSRRRCSERFGGEFRKLLPRRPGNLSAAIDVDDSAKQFVGLRMRTFGGEQLRPTEAQLLVMPHGVDLTPQVPYHFEIAAVAIGEDQAVSS